MNGNLAVLAITVPLVACVVDVPESVEGKPCPCPAEGYVCRDDVCVASDGEGPGGGGVGAGSSTGSGADCLVTAADFRPTWSTPETIRWDWTNQGRAEDFVGYAIVVAGSEEDVASTSGSARVFDGTVNPELAFYIAPREGGPFPVVYSITDGLDPLDPGVPGRGRYFAQLRVTDVHGCVFASDIAQSTTKLAPIDAVTFFDEEWDGQQYGAPLSVVDGCGWDGGACMQCLASDGCLVDGWDELRPVHLDAPFDLGAVPENAFATGQAYLETRIAIVSTTPSYYTEMHLVRHGEEAGDLTFWGIRRLPLRAETPDAVYETIQLPLNGLTLEDGTPLSFEDLQTPFGSLYIGSELLDATEVRLDTIAVRW